MASQSCLLHSSGRCAAATSRPKAQQRQHTQRSSVIVQGLHHHYGSNLTPVKDAILPRDSTKRLSKAIKRARQATTTQGEAAVSQLLQELKRLELHQLTDDKQCSTVSLAHKRPAAKQHTTTPSTVAVHLPATHGLSTVQIPVPLEADMLDISSPEYAPRDYEVQGRVLVCQGSKCRSKGALGVLQAVSAVAGGNGNVQVLPCKCLGKCKEGAVVRVKQDGSPKCAVYTQVHPQQVPAMLDSHFLQQQGGSEQQQHQGSACCTDCKQ